MKCPDCKTEMNEDEKKDLKCPNCGVILLSYKGPKTLKISFTTSTKELEENGGQKIVKSIMDGIIDNFQDEQ